MEYKKFEEHLSETLYNDEVSLDINALIHNIHGKKKDKKRFIFWILFMSFIVLTGSMTYYSFSNGANSNNNKNVNSPNKSLNASNVVTDVNDTEYTVQEAFVNENDKFNNSSTLVNENINSNKSNKSKSFKRSSPKRTSKVINQNEENLMVKTQNETDNYSGTQVEAIRNQEGEIDQLTTVQFKNLHYQYNILKNDKIICPSFRKKNKFQIELIPEIGLFLPIKKLENLTGETNSTYSLREQNEKSLEGINAGLYIQLRQEKRPIYFKVGLTWSKLTEKMPLQYSYSRKDTTQGIISITYSQTGDTITTIIGDVITERRLSGNKTKHHQISLIDLPLGVGFEKNFGRWFASVEGGVLVNLSMHSKGNILVSDTSFVDVNTPVDHFKPGLGLSYFGGILFGRDIYKGGRLFIAARARFLPDPFNMDTNRIRQSYNFMGVNLGYVWSF